MKKAPWLRFFSGDWMADVRFLAPLERSALIDLFAIMHQAGEPIPDEPMHLARACNMTKAQFVKSRDALLAAGKIARVDGKLWSFFIENEREFAEEKSRSATRNINERWRKAQQNQSEGDTTVVRSNYRRNTIQNQSHIQRKKEKETRAEASGVFDVWWNSYPNKIGRDAAERAYASALQDGVDPDELLRAAERYRLGKPSGQAWASPATWLKNRRWTDGPLAPKDQPEKRPTARQRIREEILRTQELGFAPLADDDGMVIDGTATRG